MVHKVGLAIAIAQDRPCPMCVGLGAWTSVVAALSSNRRRWTLVEVPSPYKYTRKRRHACERGARAQTVPGWVVPPGTVPRDK